MNKVKVYTAIALSAPLKAKVEQFIAKKVDDGEIEYLLDKSLLGGIKIVIGDIVYDATVRRKLDIIEGTV